MDDLVTWLTGTLDAIEQSAPHAHRRGCETLSNYLYASGVTESPMHEECDCDGPRAVLARVEGERAVVELHAPMPSWSAKPHCTSCDRDWYYLRQEPVDRAWPCLTLRFIAWGRRFDALGWREEWAPESVATTP